MTFSSALLLTSAYVLAAGCSFSAQSGATAATESGWRPLPLITEGHID
jgi:hypothetical protein